MIQFTRRALPVLLLALICLGCNESSEAQLEATAEEQPQLDRLKKIFYGTGQMAFKETGPDLSQPKPGYDLPFETPADASPASEVMAALPTALKAKSLERFGDLFVSIYADFPGTIDVDESLLDLELVSMDVKDANGKVIERGNIRNNNDYSVKNGDDLQLPFTGQVTVKASYSNEYQTVTISKADIGKTVRLGDIPLTVVDIEGHRAILKIPSDTDVDYSVAALNNEGVLMGLDFEKRDELGLGMSAGGSGTTTIDGKVYEIFAANPKISESAFGDAIHNYLLESIRNKDKRKEKISVVTQLGPIEQLVIYNTVRSTPKTVTVSLAN